MRVMKYVFIHPKVGLWGEEYNGRIRDEERSLGYFLGLYLKNSNISYEKFDGVFFEGTDDPEISITIQNKLLIVPIPMFEKEYPSEIDIFLVNEYLIYHLYLGIDKIKESYSELANLLMQGVDAFKKNGYICTWMHKKKKLSKNYVALQCTLTISYFQLDLLILNSKKEIIFLETILKTPPNEYSFKHRFKDIIVNDDILYVTDFLNNKWFELDVSNFY